MKESTGELRVGEALVRYQVVRSARRQKTIEITVDAVRGVRVAAPMKASETRIREVVEKRAAWIIATINKAQTAAPPAKRFADGEAFQYMGRALQLRVTQTRVPPAFPTAQLDGPVSTLHVSIPVGAPDIEACVRPAVTAWFRARALERLTIAVEQWSAVMGLQATRVLVRNQRTLWGSCAADGTLRFNWRTVQVAPALMDYVVVHELAHLRHRSHSNRFWREVARSMPDYLDRRCELQIAGRALGL